MTQQRETNSSPASFAIWSRQERPGSKRQRAGVTTTIFAASVAVLVVLAGVLGYFALVAQAAPPPGGITTVTVTAPPTTVTVTRTVTATGTTPPPSQLFGTIEIDGSSTVYPITEAVAEEFGHLYPNVRVNVGISGTGGGFKRFVVGETDISDASRPIASSEVQQAQQNGIQYLDIRVAIDGLAVMVHPSNTFVSCLTVGELKHIWEPGSTVNRWSDVRPEWPDSPMRLYGPGTDSGTFDYFTEEVVGTAKASRPDYTASEDDNVLVRGIAGDVNALGYFGYAYYAVNTETLKIVAIDGGNGCVIPSDATVSSGEYPLSRPLFIYVNIQALQRPEVRAFVEFYLEQAFQLVQEVGYTAYEPAVYQEQLAALRASQ